MLINLNKPKTGFATFFVSLITIISFNWDFNSYISNIFGLVFLFIIPGLLFFLVFSDIKKYGWEMLTYIVGLSISFVIFSELILNFALNFLGVNEPLLPQYLAALFICLQILGAGYINFKKQFEHIEIELPEINIINIVGFLVPIIIFCLALIGVNILNNGGSNNLSISISFLIVICYILLFFNYTNKTVQWMYPYFLYVISLSLILMFSLRSNYLIGFDIHQEFGVFKITNLHQLWEVSKLHDAYNACLSITILPNAIYNFTSFSGLDIFKIVYPLIIAFVPVIVYNLIKKVSTPYTAFLAASIYLMQPQFLLQLPALTRQGIAYLYLALILNTLMTRVFLSKNLRTAMLYIFAASIVVSHYSTTYLTVFVVVVTYLISKIFGLVMRKKYDFGINFLFVVYFIAITVFWNTIITNTSDNIVNTVSSVYNNAGNIMALDTKSEFIKGALNLSSPATQADLQTHAHEVTEYYKRYFGDTIVNEDDINGKLILLTEKNENPSANEAGILRFFHQILPWYIRLAIAAGFFIMLYRFFKQNKDIGKYLEFILINTVQILLLFAALILPGISIQYNFERLYQQTLMSLALLAVIGITIIPIPYKKISFLFINIVLILSFFQSIGLVDQFILGQSNMNFNNRGSDYDRYYTTDAEYSSLRWLQSIRKYKDNIHVDRYTLLKSEAYMDEYKSFLIETLIPTAISKSHQSFVYLGRTNIKERKLYDFYKDIVIPYNYPLSILDDNKNLIYSNDESRIYN
jgi:uncharacterized membrane protein